LGKEGEPNRLSSFFGFLMSPIGTFCPHNPSNRDQPIVFVRSDQAKIDKGGGLGKMSLLFKFSHPPKVFGLRWRSRPWKRFAGARSNFARTLKCPSISGHFDEREDPSHRPSPTIRIAEKTDEKSASTASQREPVVITKAKRRPVAL
jgi:hypothetical protein